MVAEGPLTEIDSITSGYIVPWASHFTPSISLETSLKTSIKTFPIIFLFCSGSSTFLREFINFLRH